MVRVFSQEKMSKKTLEGGVQQLFVPPCRLQILSSSLSTLFFETQSLAKSDVCCLS